MVPEGRSPPQWGGLASRGRRRKPEGPFNAHHQLQAWSREKAIQMWGETINSQSPPPMTPIPYFLNLPKWPTNWRPSFQAYGGWSYSNPHIISTANSIWIKKVLEWCSVLGNPGENSPPVFWLPANSECSGLHAPIPNYLVTPWIPWSLASNPPRLRQFSSEENPLGWLDLV